MQFTSSPRGARLARRLAAVRLAEWGFPEEGDVSQTAVLLVGELTANAVRHGHVPGRDFGLRLAVIPPTAPESPPVPGLVIDASTRPSESPGSPPPAIALTSPMIIRIEVSDARGEKRPVRPSRPPASADVSSTAPPESGRGLLLLETLATRWGVSDRTPIGKTVWAALDVDLSGNRSPGDRTRGEACQGPCRRA